MSLQLQFKINEPYLIIHTLEDQIDPFFEWAKVRSDLWKFQPIGWGLLCGKPSRVGLDGKFKHASKAIRESITFVKKRLEYSRLLKETDEYLKFLEREWRAKGKKALSILQKLSGLELPNKTISVFVTHPKQYNGCYLGNFCIGWGHPEEWENYSVVYLCHEIMHALTEGQGDDLLHSIIELMVDDELRIQLSGKGKYGEVSQHESLSNIRKTILPYWEKYVAKPNGNIFTLHSTLTKVVLK